MTSNIKLENLKNNNKVKPKNRMLIETKKVRKRLLTSLYYI